MSDAIDSKKISRRSIVAGIAALGVYGLARNARAAETRPLAERLAAYAAALRRVKAYGEPGDAGVLMHGSVR